MTTNPPAATVEAKLLTRLVEAYRNNPVGVAKACDEQIDRSGNLLGYLREAASLTTQAVEPVVTTSVRQSSPIIGDYADHFLVAHVNKDGSIVGIDHPCDADWSDVMRAHIALRDRVNSRIAEQDGCPFKPSLKTPEQDADPSTKPPSP